jgi:hypothetical protein
MFVGLNGKVTESFTINDRRFFFVLLHSNPFRYGIELHLGRVFFDSLRRFAGSMARLSGQHHF